MDYSELKTCSVEKWINFMCGLGCAVGSVLCCIGIWMELWMVVNQEPSQCRFKVGESDAWSVLWI